MKKRNTKNDDQVHFHCTYAEKKELYRLADIHKKSLTDFLMDAAMSLSLDTAKMSFYQGINNDLNEIKKQLFILNRVMLFIGSAEQKHNSETIVKLFHDTEERANKLFGMEE